MVSAHLSGDVVEDKFKIRADIYLNDTEVDEFKKSFKHNDKSVMIHEIKYELINIIEEAIKYANYIINNDETELKYSILLKLGREFSNVYKFIRLLAQIDNDLAIKYAEKFDSFPDDELNSIAIPIDNSIEAALETGSAEYAKSIETDVHDLANHLSAIKANNVLQFKSDIESYLNREFDEIVGPVTVGDFQLLEDIGASEVSSAPRLRPPTDKRPSRRHDIIATIANWLGKVSTDQPSDEFTVFKNRLDAIVQKLLSDTGIRPMIRVQFNISDNLFTIVKTIYGIENFYNKSIDNSHTSKTPVPRKVAKKKIESLIADGYEPINKTVDSDELGALVNRLSVANISHKEFVEFIIEQLSDRIEEKIINTFPGDSRDLFQNLVTIPLHLDKPDKLGTSERELVNPIYRPINDQLYLEVSSVTIADAEYLINNLNERVYSLLAVLKPTPTRRARYHGDKTHTFDTLDTGFEIFGALHKLKMLDAIEILLNNYLSTIRFSKLDAPRQKSFIVYIVRLRSDGKIDVAGTLRSSQPKLKSSAASPWALSSPEQAMATLDVDAADLDLGRKTMADRYKYYRETLRRDKTDDEDNEDDDNV